MNLHTNGPPGNAARATVAVIFSKDRALQLDATVRSFERQCGDRSSVHLVVLYATSTPHYRNQYRRLALAHPTVQFVAERDFKSELEALVAGAPYVLFIVDDTIFFRPFAVEEGVGRLAQDSRCVGFSYRLGGNTTYCHPLDRVQIIPSLEGEGTIVDFNWQEGDADFGYPLELSSSLYRSSDLGPLLKDLRYWNPNSLEAAMAHRALGFASEKPRLACYRRSVAVSVPANRVQETAKNRTGGDPGQSSVALAEAFDRGLRIDLEPFAGLDPVGCHQELQFSLVRDDTVPTVTVVIPCYGQASLLPEAVRSVISQEFTDWELLIVDDGSPDDTAAVGERLIAHNPGRRIRVLRQANGGVSHARNAGIAGARGKYILPLDADDAIAPSYLERAVSILDIDPSVAIVYTDKELAGAASGIEPNPEFNAFLQPAVNHLNYCALFRSEVWEAVGGYNRNMVQGYEDWDFWVGAVERGYRAKRVPEPLFRYRVSLDGMLSRARQHDSELRRQMRSNHPRVFRPWWRVARWMVRAVRAMWRLASGESRYPAGPS